MNELGEKSRVTIILGEFCEQAIIKLSLAYSFRKMFSIGQNLKHVHITYSFLELLIFFCLKKYCMGNQSWNTIHELVSDNDVENPDVKLKLLMNKFYEMIRNE